MGIYLFKVTQKKSVTLVCSWIISIYIYVKFPLVKRRPYCATLRSLDREVQSAVCSFYVQNWWWTGFEYAFSPLDGTKAHTPDLEYFNTKVCRVGALHLFSLEGAVLDSWHRRLHWERRGSLLWLVISGFVDEGREKNLFPRIVAAPRSFLLPPVPPPPPPLWSFVH